jgi:hypothetical protein
LITISHDSQLRLNVKEEQPPGREHPGHFGHRGRRLLHVLEEVHGADHVEAAARVRQGLRVAALVAHAPGAVVSRRHRQAVGCGVEPRDLVPVLGQRIAEEARAAADVEDRARAVAEFLPDALAHPRIAQPRLGAQQRHRVILRRVPALAHLVVDRVVHRAGFCCPGFHSRLQ